MGEPPADLGERARAQVAERCDGGAARLELCDLAELSSVRDLGRRLNARGDGLDVLAHNAGVLAEERTLTELLTDRLAARDAAARRPLRADEPADDRLV